MELRHLRCFLAVAEELHFARAAERLHIEQSPLSRAIKELEEELGVVLFARTTRSTRLTRVGKLFLDHVPRVFAALQQARDSVKAAANGFHGQLRIAPTREGYVNAIQVWPYSDGALYQVYAAPGRVTVVSLQPGEELVTVAAGDTVRWIVGDTSSGSGEALRVNVLVKPTRSGLKTNLVITTSRRTYLLELTSTEKAWMASVSWDYPKDRMLALQRQSQAAQTAAPVDTGLALEKIRFRYAISGSNPPWKPQRAFDDGEKVYIQFPRGIAQGELPPLFVIGAQGDGQLVNYRFRSPYYIVDRLFGAPGHAPEPAHAGHPRRRPVGRRTRCADVVAAAAAAHGQRADRALQRRSCLQVRRAGCAAGGLLQAAAGLAVHGARTGAATAGRSWPGHRQVAAARDGRLHGPWPRPQRCAAQGSRSGRSVVRVLPLRHAEGRAANAAFDPMAAGPASTAAQPADPTAVQNRQDQKEAFQKAGTTETRNSGNLTLPASPYQVMAGALVTGIKSDLPGDVIATVTEPVYDTATGKFLLIPQGSRILGRYNSQVSYGQSRVQVVWNWIILPDTSSLTLDNLVGTDPAGYAGLEDDVDYHWGRIFAGAALTTLLGVGAELAAPENRQDGNRIVIAGRDSAQDSINQVGQEMTRRNMNIQPTLTERPGLPVRIIANRDLVLRPYQPVFFNKGTSR